MKFSKAKVLAHLAAQEARALRDLSDFPLNAVEQVENSIAELEANLKSTRKRLQAQRRVLRVLRGGYQTIGDEDAETSRLYFLEDRPRRKRAIREKFARMRATLQMIEGDTVSLTLRQSDELGIGL